MKIYYIYIGDTMKTKVVKVGQLEENCYIIEEGEKCLIIDPGDEYEKINKKIVYDLVGVIITHHHSDHTGALAEIIQNYETAIYDSDNLKEGINKIDDFTFEVIKTPGHTSDSITIYFREEKAMFTGDFIFYHDIGRTDLPSGSLRDMINSIYKIKKYPEDTIIYPGHNRRTSLKEELKYLDTYL